mgnify:CR=1 FL=1
MPKQSRITFIIARYGSEQCDAITSRATDAVSVNRGRVLKDQGKRIKDEKRDRVRKRDVFVARDREVANCDLKEAGSSAVNWNMKSSGNRARLPFKRYASSKT